MADFLIAYNITLGHEGGYANNPNDTGGETYMGVSRNNWPKWEGWKLIDQLTRNVPRYQFDEVLRKSSALLDMIRAFYKKEFWDKMLLDKFTNQDIANEMFDTGVNAGTSKAVDFLQEAIRLTYKPGIKSDGAMGPVTLSCANSYPHQLTLLRMLNGMQAEHYLNIIRRKPSQSDFARSWFSRTVSK